jgi:hypothetical protein
MALKIKSSLPLPWFLNQAIALFFALFITDGGWALVVLLLSYIPLNIWFCSVGGKLKGRLAYSVPYLLLMLSVVVTGSFV